MSIDDSKENDMPVERESTTPTSEDQFRDAWAASFGIAPVQITFPDNELNARVYKLDGDSGYRVRERKVVVGQPSWNDDPGSDIRMADSDSLMYPKKARKGETHGRSKISQQVVLEIREWAKVFLDKNEKPPYTAKSKTLGISDGALRDIVNRRTWRHI